MSKKNDSFYFNNFRDCAELAGDAAMMLKEILLDYNIHDLEKRLHELHEIENKADDKKHKLISKLKAEFISPIERNDIIKISQSIDNVTDAIEDILMQMYITGVDEIRGDTIPYTELIIVSCDLMKNLFDEFKHFKKSKKLTPIIIEMNKVEEEGDKLFMQAMRKLHCEENNPLLILSWREIYTYFETVCDACEEVADIVESIVIANT